MRNPIEFLRLTLESRCIKRNGSEVSHSYRRKVFVTFVRYSMSAARAWRKPILRRSA